MNNWFSRTVVLAGLLTFGLTSCEKDEVRVTSEFGAPPVLTASATNLGVLSKANAANTALTFSWTPYTIKFSDNSKPVSGLKYTLQLARTGTNFATVEEIDVPTNTATSLAIKTSDLNRAMLALRLPVGQSARVDARLKTEVAGNMPTMFSGTTTITATPYDECSAPNSDTWALIGPAGVDWNTDVPLTWSCTDNAYVVTRVLQPGDFKFRSNQAWTVNLGALTKPMTPGATPTPLKPNGEDMTISTAGTYTVKLTVTGSGANVTAGSVTITR